MSDEIQGGSTTSLPTASIGARFLAALFDLVFMPILLGVIFGLIFINADATLRNIVLVIVNIAWTCLRDIKGGAGPGKRMAGIKVVETDSGNAPGLGKLVFRNLLIWLPFVLLFGFIIEAIFIFILRKDRLGDTWAKTSVVSTR